jgi:NodT family efflux transporter outer membrane factor (OMF) lipoprotein
MRRLAVALSLALPALGCVSVPPTQPVAPPVASSAMGLSPDAAPSVPQQWWVVYGDPQLNRLIEQALAGSPTLAEATARLARAQAEATAAGSRARPAVTFEGQEIRERFGARDIFPPPFGGSTVWYGQLNLRLAWNLDFWGRQAALIHAAENRSIAVQLDSAAARLALQGAVTQVYLELDRAYALLDVARATEEKRTRIAELAGERFGAGLETNVELKSAQALVPQARVERSEAQTAVELAIHQLAALAGLGASAYAQIERPRLALASALPLPQTLPADLLARRPDILAARERLNAASASRLAARAEFYPNIDLIAFAGYASINLSDLLAPPARTYGVGPTARLPIFDAGLLRAQYAGASADLNAAVARYNATVLGAVRDVSDQLTRLLALQHELIDQRQAVDLAEETYRLSDKRYRAGVTGQLVVLDAATHALSGQRDLVNLQSAESQAQVALLVALGGGFGQAASAPVSMPGASP